MSHGPRAGLGDNFINGCCQNIDQLIKKPVLFPIEAHGTVKAERSKKLESIKSEEDAMECLKLRLRHTEEVRAKVSAKTQVTSQEAEGLFLEQETDSPSSSGTGQIDISKVAFFEVNQNRFEQNSDTINKLAGEVKALTQFGSHQFFGKLGKRDFEEEISSRSIQLTKEHSENLKLLSKTLEAIRQNSHKL